MFGVNLRDVSLFLFVMITIPVLQAQEFMCCSQATGSCRTICEKISLVEIAANSTRRDETVQQVEKFCSSQLSSFWDCLNATFKEISRGEGWSGRVCCPLPLSEMCKRACVVAVSQTDLVQGCRQSDEIAFFACLDRQTAGDSCCSQANTQDCRDSCYGIFRNHLTPSRYQRNLVNDLCESSSPKVINCVKNVTKVTPATNLHKYLHCCDKSSKVKCRETCKEALASKTTHQEVIDGLQLGGCGPPLLQDHFWQCFLQSNEPIATSVEVSRIDRVGMDSAKWHCCQRATSSQCRRLCSRTFTKDWSTLWDEFSYKCLSKVSEEKLRSCIDEVDEPCELGCDGLSFCTNFNNRPTELFRSCTPQADEAAQNDVILWQNQNDLRLPGLNLPLRNISECSPNTWKAVACTLQIKPCSRHSHANQICRDVCLDILSLCVDWTRVPIEHTPESICSTLSPEHPDVSCISLKNYLNPSENPYQKTDGQVSSPCKGDPCDENEICMVNNNCVPGSSCSPYKCLPGCKLGEVSEYMVPEGTYVRIPIPNNPKGCLKICRCSEGSIVDCQPLPCVSLNSCFMGNSQHKEHGAVFNLDCNTCSCFAEEIICSKKQCESTALSGKNVAYTTLPCNCPPHYIPVCGRNGNTYPSSCLAKCAGLNDSDFEFGSCHDPCKNNPCPVGEKCVPDPQVCLSLMHKPCNQYQCINGTMNCNELTKSPVCDTENKEHINSCALAYSNAKLAYKGSCLAHCKYTGSVCGINGKTYISECAAWADFITVDYPGSCITVGLISEGSDPQCQSVKCRQLSENCAKVTPPGACCPVCGGALKLLYSRKQIDRALYALPNRNTRPLTLQALLGSLERHIQVAQCVLRGYLSVELDIFIIVQASERYPSQVQLEACVRECEKLASLINRQSPRIASELSLSSLTAATTVHSLSTTYPYNQYNGVVISSLSKILHLVIFTRLLLISC